MNRIPLCLAVGDQVRFRAGMHFQWAGVWRLKFALEQVLARLFHLACSVQEGRSRSSSSPNDPLLMLTFHRLFQVA